MAKSFPYNATPALFAASGKPLLGIGGHATFGHADNPRRFAGLCCCPEPFTPTMLGRAFHKLGFVQADPIRAPARAQDLILPPREGLRRRGLLRQLWFCDEDPAGADASAPGYLCPGGTRSSLACCMH